MKLKNLSRWDSFRFEYQKKGEIYMAMLELAKDCIVNINGSNPTLEQLRKLPLVNIEFAIVGSF